MEYLIGTSGWAYDHWKDKFYPEGVPKRRWLEFYAGEFATVEINYSFYRWPSEKTLAAWCERTPAGFRFTLKAPRTITHLKKLRDVARLVRDFYRLTDKLKEKAGCHLFQLPPSFRRDDDNVALLKKVLASLPRGRDNAVEFRHESWWHDEAYELLRTYGVAFCTVSGLGMPAEVVATADAAYFRFHGERYATRYPLREMESYAAAIAALPGRRVYAYFNNDAEAYAVANARELRTALGG